MANCVLLPSQTIQGYTVAYRGVAGGESPRAALPNGAALGKAVAKIACKIGGYRCKNENLKVND